MRELRDIVAVVDDVLDAPTCAAAIERIERIEHIGLEPTRVRDAIGSHVDAALRNNTRVWLDDAALAQRIFAAIAPAVCTLRAQWSALFDGEPLECEATFRDYRYRAGERFAPHVDSAFVRDDGARTILSVLVYLNSDVDGGATSPTRGSPCNPSRAGHACSRIWCCTRARSSSVARSTRCARMWCSRDESGALSRSNGGVVRLHSHTRSSA